ncbi:MAG: hypothetical protein K6F93_04680 [Lachnospiraceae bacterium]|nr:hypothetical protein [Lachnospiraceae bacterium]
MKSIFGLVKFNVKLVMNYNMLICIGIIVVGLITFGLVPMSRGMYYRMNEFVLIFVGPVSLLSIADLECREHVWEMVYAKQQRMISVLILRLVLVFIADAMLFSVPYFLVWYSGNSEIGFTDYLGCLITALWFGLVGFVLTEITGSRQVGVCTLVVYYLLEVITAGKYTKEFTLVGYLTGRPETKRNLMYATAVLVVLVLCFDYFKIRGIYDNRDRVTQ